MISSCKNNKMILWRLKAIDDNCPRDRVTADDTARIIGTLIWGSQTFFSKRGSD
jgi:hypothetical protein